MLTVFIGGIALGAFLVGKLIRKYFPLESNLDPEFSVAIKTGQSYSLIFIYGLLELAVAIYAIFVPFLLGPDFLGFIWSNFALLALDQPILGMFLKFIVSAIFLLPPTLLIGSGFPILSEILTLNKKEGDSFNDEELIESSEQLAISNLYATNTMGAILGALLTGFFMLPSIGLNASVYLASMVNFIVVLMVAIVFYLNRKNLEGAKTTEVFQFIYKYSVEARKNLDNQINKLSSHNPEYKKYKFIISTLIWIGFFLGFVNLALEVVWTKVLTLVIGSSTYSITLILIAVLLGISLGAYLLNFFIEFLHKWKIHYYDFLKVLLFLFALSIVVSSSLFNALPWFFLNMNNFFESFSFIQDLWLVQNFLKFSLVSLIAFPVTFIEGIAFAFILYLVSSKTSLVSEDYQDPVGTRIARVSSMNTFGAILGSFLTGFVFIPVFSYLGDASYFTILLIIAVAFFTIYIPYLLESKEKWQLIAIFIFAILVMFYVPKLDAQELSSGANIYKNSKFKQVNKKDYQKSINQKILFHKEGLNSTVTVEENTVVNAIFLKNNGKIEAGVPINIKEPSKTDMMTQILLGKLPILIKPDTKKALLIGMGSGVTLKSLADANQVSEIKEIDVCELEKLVYEAADKFFVKKYPSQVKINRHVADARIFLQASKEKNYDLIISQPSDPWISGPLFTKEFWSTASEKMNEDGLFVQWLQLYSIDPEYLTIALRTFQQVFPNTLVFKSGSAAELILVGSKTEIDINSSEINRLLSHESYQPDLAYIGIENAADLLSNLILTPKSLSRLVHSERALKTGFDNNAKVKIIKYISDVKDEASLKPKLSLDNLSDEKYKEAVGDFKGQTSTDDNMLLEFHTSKNLDNFYKTIQANEALLFKYLSPESMIEFFVEDSEPGFLLDLALAHNNAVRDSEIYKISTGRDSEIYVDNVYQESLHGNLALSLAERLHEISKTPKSYLTLYEIYKKQGEPEKAEALVYDSRFFFSDLISFRKKNRFSKPKLVIFEGLIKKKIDADDLAALATLYNYEEDSDVSEALIDNAFEYYKEHDLDDKKLLAHLYFVQSRVYSERIKTESEDRARKMLFVKSFDALNKAIDLDKYNSSYYVEIAKLDLQQADINSNEKYKLMEAARLNLEKAISIYPSDAVAHFHMAKIYLSKLPKTQIELMTVLNSPVSKRADLENLDNAIRYLRNALSLEPLSVSANFEMGDLQYRIGNIDLAFRHIKRLRRLCLAEMLCLNELGETKLEHAKELYQKMNNLIVR